VRKDGVIFIAGSSLDAIFLTSNKNLTLTSEFGEVEKSNTELNKHNSNIWGRVVISTQRSRDVWYNEKDKILWSANSDGVVYYKNKKVNTLFDTKSNKQVIATCFQNLENNLLCIGTVDQGIYIIQDTSIVLHYTTKNGLQSNQINKIKADEQNIWAITDKGIQRFNLSTNNFINISKSDGLISNQVFDMAIANNTVYISTSKGLQFLPVNAIKTSNQLPFLGIKKVSINDSIYNYKNTILLNSKNGNIEIELEYALLKNSGNIALKYRMIGLDTLWIEDKAFNNIIRYNTLSSGSYKFEAVCMNDDGVESKPVTIHFTVLKPWWLQWWFLITAACISILLVIFFTKLYLNISKNKIAEELKKSKLQEEARQSQLASLKAQMNPHFMFNALNSIQEYILLSDKRLANMYLGKFADLMRLILDQSNKEIISLEEELKILNLYLELEALRFEENFEYIIQKENIEDEAEINIPAMLIQPYVENAIKHGLLHKQGLKKISIHFKLQKNKLLCVVEDNGIGRKRSGEINALRNKKYTSFATGATQKRLELLNQNNPNLIVVNYTDLTLNNTTYIGTKVSIVIPIIEL
ncbi:MAG TPA: histidine kinase, partial [Chitinophagaceae bacterium]|nr:histidine kinase [Chitinophagaceae bacterium]